jgi:hypothetical protein
MIKTIDLWRGPLWFERPAPGIKKTARHASTNRHARRERNGMHRTEKPHHHNLVETETQP